MGTRLLRRLQERESRLRKASLENCIMLFNDSKSWKYLIRQCKLNNSSENNFESVSQNYNDKDKSCIIS